MNLSFLRCLRDLKIAKVIRVVRAVRFFQELRMMLNSVLGSFLMLFWCTILLLFLIYVFSIVIMQLLTLDAPIDEEPVFTNEKPLLECFGSVQNSTITLMQSTMGG